MTVDRSLQRQQAQLAALAKRTEHKPFQRVGVEVNVPGPTRPPVVRILPTQNGIGNQVETVPTPVRWQNLDQPVVRADKNSGEYNYSNCDWRWGN